MIITSALQRLSQYEVVDGQQRLTTIVIMLLVLKEQMVEHELIPSIISQLQELYLLMQKESGESEGKLTLNEDTREYFAAMINQKSMDTRISAEQRLNNCYRFFRVQLFLLIF